MAAVGITAFYVLVWMLVHLASARDRLRFPWRFQLAGPLSDLALFPFSSTGADTAEEDAEGQGTN